MIDWAKSGYGREESRIVQKLDDLVLIFAWGKHAKDNASVGGVSGDPHRLHRTVPFVEDAIDFRKYRGRIAAGYLVRHD